MNLNIVYLGMVPYSEALEIQYKLLEMRQNNEIGNTLLLLEHPPVLTLGARGQYNNIYLSSAELKNQGVELFEVNRGGDVTYHGPGQIMGYAIFNLRDIDKDIRLFVEKMGQSIIKLLKHKYSIDAYMGTDKHTGVWVNDKKITAIGIAVKKWVTMHGFAFNVSTNLDHFNWINPCGLSMGVTSLEQLTGKKQDIHLVFKMVEEYFAKEFQSNIVSLDLKDLIK